MDFQIRSTVSFPRELGMFPSLLLHYVGGTFSSKYYAVRRAHFALKGCVIPATGRLPSDTTRGIQAASRRQIRS